MSKFERGYTPLTSINRIDESRITIGESIMDTAPRDVGINLKRTHSMMRTGGLKSLHIDGEEGPTSKITIDAIELDAVMVPEKYYEETVPLSRWEKSENEGGISRAKWGDAAVVVNATELDKRVRDGQPRTEHDTTKKYAAELDNAVKGGINKAGFDQLVTQPFLSNPREMSTSVSLGTTTGVMALFDGGSFPQAAEAGALAYLGVNGISNIADRIKYQLRHDLQTEDGFRWSLFTGPQFDRADLLRLRTDAQSIIKPLPKK